MPSSFLETFSRNCATSLRPSCFAIISMWSAPVIIFNSMDIPPSTQTRWSISVCPAGTIPSWRLAKSAILAQRPIWQRRFASAYHGRPRLISNRDADTDMVKAFEDATLPVWNVGQRMAFQVSRQKRQRAFNCRALFPSKLASAVVATTELIDCPRLRPWFWRDRKF